MRRRGNDSWRWVRSYKGVLVVVMVLAGCMALAGVFRVSTDIDEGVPDPQTQKKKVRPSTALVTTATEAPSTPPPPCAAHRSCGNCLTQSGCYWCANADSFEVDQSSGRCIDSSTPSFAVTCEDIEDNSCPFILSENYKANTAANFRVIHVGIQKGGPEALIQMHLALLFWGFRTTLDTRKNKQGMEIKPFFKKAYSTELARSPELRWFGSYDEWLTTGKPEDVFIETETWKCRQNLQYFQGKGRQLQWHLTVWKKNNREDCTISAHTHYIAKDYMHISTRAVMYPYISPHIHKLSSAAVLKDPSFKDKENLVMYDADAGLTEKDFVLKGAVSFTTRIAQGLKPEVLYALYAKAKVCIDMKMPGAERFVYEAALFGCCIITDRDGNGADDLDLPIPARFKIAPGDMVTLNKRVQEILGSFEEVSKEFAPLRRFVTSQRVSFLRQVRRYYSDNIHIVGFMGEGRTEGELLSFVLSHVLSTPFATVEVVQCAGQEVKLNAGTFRTLRERTLLAAVKFTTAQCTGDAELAAGYALPFPGRVSHVLAYTDIRYVPSLEDLVAVLSTELDSQHEASHGDKTALSLGPHILFAFSKHFAYVWKCWLHGSCRNVHPTTADTMYKSQVSPLIASMQSSDLMPTEFLCQHPVYANKSVQTLLPTKMTAVNLESRLDDTGQMMTELSSRFESPAVSRGPGTPGSSARIERINLDIALYTERLDDTLNSHPESLRALCKEVLGQYGDTKHELSELTSKFQQQQKELDNATRMLRQQQSLVSAGLVAKRPQQQHPEIALMTRLIQEMEGVIEHVKSTHTVSTLPQDFVKVHRKLGEVDTLDFAESVLNVRCRLATLLDDVIRPCSVKHAAGASPMPPSPSRRELSMQKEKIAASHSTLLAVMGKFGLVGRVVSSEASVDEGIDKTMLDSERLLTAVEDNLASALKRLGRIVANIVPFPAPLSSASSFIDYIANCSSHLEDFSSKSLKDLSEMTSAFGFDSAVHAASPTVISLITRAKQISLSKMPQNPQEATSTRMKHILNLSGSILELVSPEDADRMKDRDIEAVLRTAVVHIEAACGREAKVQSELQEAKQLLAEATAARQTETRRIAHIGDILSEIILDPSKLSLRDASGELSEIEIKLPKTDTLSVEEKLSELHLLYQEKRDKNFELEAELDACNVALNRFFGEFDREFDFISTEPLKLKLDTLPKVLALSRKRGNNHDTNTSDDEAILHQSEGTMHKIYAMLRAGDKQWGSGQVDLNSVEAAVEGLTQRVRSAERRAAELETHSRRIMSKIQNIISSYDYRSPAKRHVHIGDDIDEDSDDFSSGALHDLEALLQTLVKGGNKDASYRIERDYVLDNVEENLRVILPHVESLVGVPAGADRGVDLMVTPSDDSLSRLTVTMSRWKRALDHFKMSQPSSGYGGEKVLLRTVQHFTSRLRAALSCQDLPGDIGEGSRPPSTFQSIEGDSLEVAVNELDHYTTAASAVVEKYGGERTRVLATLQTIIAAAAEVGKMKGPKEGESEVHAVSQMAAACVADLVGRYSGTHTRLQRLSSAVLSSAAAVDKIMPSKNEARSMSLSRRNEDVPEFVLQESITRLTARVGGKVRTPEQLETPGSPQSVPEGTVEQLRFLASQAPAGSSLDDLVSCVGERLAAFESDRAVQKKEGERARTAWRKLHDEVTRRLAPLLDILEDKASRSRTPPPREQEDEGKKAFNTIWRLEERVMALNRQHQVLTQDHAGERSRRIDLEQRLKSIKKQYAKTSKELVRMCVVTEVTAVPVADELSSDIDIEATSRSLYEAVVTLSETAGQVSQMREQVMTSSTDAEESKAHAAKTDMRHLHLLNAVTDVLSVLGLMPSAPCDGDNTWDAVVSGVSKLLSEVREGREARTRVQSLEIMMETLLSEVQGVPSKGAMEVPETRFSLSPLTAASIGSPPRRQPPPSPPTESPAPHTDDFKADADKMEAFRQRCTQVVDTFRTTLQSAENEKTLEADLQEAHTALQRIQATLLGQETPSHQANRQDPGVTADNVSERVQHLIEVSAASAAEKAKLIRQNLELKQDLEKAQDDVAGVREDLQDANESRGHLKRKLESANMFVSYAKEMMDDADNAAGRETDPSGDEDEEDEFKEVIAVRAYQSYLTVRKDNETLTRKLEEAEGEIEELQLQEDFFGGISAKVIALDSVCTDALGKLRQDTPSEVSSSPTSSRAPSRTPPVKPDGSPTTILNHIATMSNTLSNIKSESAALQKALQELVHSVDAISSAVGAGVSPPQSQDVLTTAAYLRSALLHLQGLIEEKVDANRSSLDTIKDMEEQRRTLLREKEGLQQQVNHQQEQLSVKQALQPRMEPPSRPPPPPDVHLSSTMPQYHPRDEYQGDRGSTLSDRHMFDLHAQPQRQQQRFMDEAVSEALSHDFAHNRHHPNMSTTSVSPQRAKGGDPRELYEIERAMFSITNKLEELVGKVPVVSESPVPTLPDIAWHLDTLCTNIVTELSYLAHKVLPGQPILDAVKSKYAAQAYSSAPEQSMERVKAHIAQLLQLGNAIASAPPRECTRMLLKSTKSGEDEDSIGLVACTRRLHVIVANKLDAAPREIKELKARSELLEAQVRSMEIEGDKRSTSLRNSTGAERKASQLLSMQKEKFEAQKRLLEERLSRAEGARDSVQEQLDAAQSNLALSRNRNAGDVGARSVSRVVSPHSSVQRHPSRSPSNQQREQQHQQQQHHGVPAAVVAAVEKENDTLKSQLQDTNTQYDEMRHAAEKLSEKLEEKEVARKDYKDKYRQALDEIEALEDEKESLKKGFAAQLTSVKEQLVKLQVQKGSRAKSASSDPQSRRTATPSSIPRDINRDSITVPQEFNLHKSKGRTGCWVCDNPDGPTKYGGTAPPHQCTAKRRRRDASPLAS